MSEVINLTINENPLIVKAKLTEKIIVKVAFSKTAIPDPRVAQALIDALNARDAAVAAAQSAIEAVDSINEVVQEALAEALSNLTTDQINEGSENLYYTQERFDAALNSKSTDDVSEGSTNKYFTNTRAVDALSAITSAFQEAIDNLNSATSTNSTNITNLQNQRPVVTGIVEIGNQSNDGSWRINNISGVLTLQKRVSAAWVTLIEWEV